MKLLIVLNEAVVLMMKRKPTYLEHSPVLI
jgi:hypothetical protein